MNTAPLLLSFSLRVYFQPPHNTDSTVHNILNEYFQIIFYWTTASKRRIRYAADDHKEKTPVWPQLQSRTLTRQPPRSPLALFPPQTRHFWTSAHVPVFLFMNFLNETPQYVHYVLFSIVVRLTHGCPRWLSDKASTCQAADTGLISGSERPPGEGNGNPFQFFLPGKSHGRNSLVGYSPWGHRRVGHDLVTKWTTNFHTVKSTNFRSVFTCVDTQQPCDFAFPKLPFLWPVRLLVCMLSCSVVSNCFWLHRL